MHPAGRVPVGSMSTGLWLIGVQGPSSFEA